MTSNNRVKVGILALSASALITIATNEGFSEKAYIPVPGDVPTIGYGTTTGVKLGDRTTPIEALKTLNRDVSRYENDIKKCIHVPVSQNEFDAFVDFSYNVGPGAFCSSTLNRYLNAGDYVNACHELLKWNKFKGKPLEGLTKRRVQEYNMCMGRYEHV